MWRQSLLRRAWIVFTVAYVCVYTRDKGKSRSQKDKETSSPFSLLLLLLLHQLCFSILLLMLCFPLFCSRPWNIFPSSDNDGSGIWNEHQASSSQSKSTLGACCFSSDLMCLFPFFPFSPLKVFFFYTQQHHYSYTVALLCLVSLCWCDGYRQQKGPIDRPCLVLLLLLLDRVGVVRCWASFIKPSNCSYFYPIQEMFKSHYIWL